MSDDPPTIHIYGGFGGPGGDGHEQVKNLNIGSQKETEIWDQIDAAKRDAIIEWLSPLNFFIRQQDISNARHPGTGEWLLDDLKFQDWKSNTGGVLWCSGIPGAGKTVLA
ncbi:hypothetical protein B0H13DRAFT_2313276 [Mycena leptocephala]|nr:hypothetical protein B0H13DRAFT_2313276 [Mycena leptocephala]